MATSLCRRRAPPLKFANEGVVVLTLCGATLAGFLMLGGCSRRDSSPSTALSSADVASDADQEPAANSAVSPAATDYDRPRGGPARDDASNDASELDEPRHKNRPEFGEDLQLIPEAATTLTAPAVHGRSESGVKKILGNERIPQPKSSSVVDPPIRLVAGEPIPGVRHIFVEVSIEGKGYRMQMGQSESVRYPQPNERPARDISPAAERAIAKTTGFRIGMKPDRIDYEVRPKATGHLTLNAVMQANPLGGKQVEAYVWRDQPYEILDSNLRVVYSYPNPDELGVQRDPLAKPSSPRGNHNLLGDSFEFSDGRPNEDFTNPNDAEVPERTKRFEIVETSVSGLRTIYKVRLLSGVAEQVTADQLSDIASDIAKNNTGIVWFYLPETAVTERPWAVSKRRGNKHPETRVFNDRLPQ